jgi:transposase-like protein
MVRKKKETNRVDEMLDELLADCQTPEDILGESGLLKQLSKRLIERALTGELNHHLKHNQETELDEAVSERPPPSNSRNGYSKKTIQSNHGEMDLAIPRDRKGEFEPVLVPKHQRRLAGLPALLPG